MKSLSLFRGPIRNWSRRRPGLNPLLGRGGLCQSATLGRAAGVRSRLRAPPGVRSLGRWPLGGARRTRPCGGSCGGAGASRSRAALAEGGGVGGQPGAAAETARWRQSPLPPDAPGDMLADNLVEDFEIEDEPWYDHRDLQQDLQLAAELGKTLLDRNTELEDSLQQMYTTNQEQLQEIEYLTKQVELLRQMNEQHAKVYEQLDVTARELEETNQKLVAESKASQQKIISLTETIECLQTNIDHLQSQVEELKSSNQGRGRQKTCDREKPAPSFSCLKELYDLRQHFVYDHVFAEKITSLQSQQSPDEEENEHLKKTVTMLQTQLSLERKKRVSVEAEYKAVLKENCDLEQQLGATDAYRARALELEAEVAEMRQMLQSEHPFVNGVEKLVPDSLFIPFKEPSQSLLEEMFLAAPEAPRKPLKRSSSETMLSSMAGGDIVKGHEETCIRRAKAVKQRGISLLHEVDTQYSALKVKYEELLRKCQQEQDSLSHKAVQTSRLLARDLTGLVTQSEAGASGWEPTPVTPEPNSSPTTTPPEYKALFKEIFSCIKKTKQEIDEQRTKCPSLSPYS